MKVFAISDLHIDYPPNLKWLMDLSSCDYTDDVLILAGDISDRLDLLERCFNQLANHFKQVIYVPGNHDLWVTRKQSLNSLEKFYQLRQLANDCGIATNPCHFNQLSIVPLLGWYDFSFAPVCDYLQERWMDFYLCKWGQPMDSLAAYSAREKAITDFFLSLNEPHLSVENEIIISFSHFLPRIDLMPDFIPPIHQKLYPILGSDALDKQIRQLRSAIHVYGHSHLNRNIDIDGVTYINNAFGNPGEERIAAKSLRCIYEIDV